ncbi:epoxide hydrolase family protein [Jatrophihabitans sp. YIM 134969]
MHTSVQSPIAPAERPWSEPVTVTTDDPTDTRPFTAAVPDADLDDLARRLATTRWPQRETVPDWTQGVRLDNLQALVERWRNGYDWRRCEARLNTFPQFVTTIDGVDVHFLHVRSQNPGAMPLVLTHGWPGSVLDFLDLIGPLTDPAAYGGNVQDSFDVVIPSLPGSGFSSAPREAGWTTARTAAAWSTLMTRLGYDRWAAHGGDWGSVVTTALGALRPDGLLGIHLNTPYAFPATIPATLSAEEQRAVDGLTRYGGELGGANHLQGTRPQTIGYALADSPVGQAAWIYDKYQAKTDNHELAEEALDVDVMLDEISLVWFTNTAATSARVYWENRAATMAGPKLTLPVAVTVFPQDVPRLPRTWIEDTYADLVHLGEAAHGGHFAALEQPQILVEEIRTGLRPLRS